MRRVDVPELLLGHNAGVPRVAEFTADTPVNVEVAARVFGTPLRLHLLRHFLRNPGSSQADAVIALGSPQRSVATNIEILIEAGVLVAAQSTSDRRSIVLSIDDARLAELRRALDDFVSPE